MAFKDFAEQETVVQLLQRSLERGRLGHAYLFCGADMEQLEAMALTLAKTLNCQNPPRRSEAGLPLDSCDACLNCDKISRGAHPDVLPIRPESKRLFSSGVSGCRPHSRPSEVAGVMGRRSVEATARFPRAPA